MTHFRGFWLFLGSSMVWEQFWAILGRLGLLLPACLLAVGARYCLLLLAFACFCLLLLLWLALACFGCFGCLCCRAAASCCLLCCSSAGVEVQNQFLLLLVLSCFGLLGLLWLLVLSCCCFMLLAAPLLELKFKFSPCFCLLFFAWPCVGTMKYGTHLELRL